MKKINNLFKNINLIHIIFIIIFINSSFQTQTENQRNLKIKRILVIIIPGGHSHNYVIQNLFDYTLSHEDKFKYEYHIILHNIDSNLWEEKIKMNNNSFTFFTYGDSLSYKESFEEGIEDMTNNPTFGYSGFNKAMILNIKQFMESDILQKLKNAQQNHRQKYNEDYYDMIITDIPNFIHKLIIQELNIKLCLYLEPALIPQLFYPNFELNPAYMPTIGSTYSDEMTFLERLSNSFTQTFSQIIFYLFQMYQSQLINSYGYDMDNSVYINDAFHMFQYPLGLSFPFSIPPNWVLLNSITANPANKIEDEKLNIFLNKYKQNIYFSYGTIIKNIINLEDLIDIFKYLKNNNIGVVLSIRKELMNDKEIKLLPENVYITRWLDQNNLLGDKRVNLFVTHGGYNSVQESVYHGKPMIVLGIGLDHHNVASLIKKRKIGEVFQSKNLINKNSIINSIEKVINEKEYYDNAKKYSNIMKDLKNPREEFKYWIDFGFKNGYQSLQIPLYKYKFSWIFVNGYDVAFIWLIIFLIIVIIIKKIINCIHDCLCGKCENKHKKNKHFKFD